MASLDSDLAPGNAAALHDGLAHPARVAARRALRGKRRLTLAQLRHAVSEAHREVDTRSMQHHVHKMQVAGLVAVAMENGREVVTLVLDVALRIKPAPPRE